MELKKTQETHVLRCASSINEEENDQSSGIKPSRVLLAK